MTPKKVQKVEKTPISPRRPLSSPLVPYDVPWSPVTANGQKQVDITQKSYDELIVDTFGQYWDLFARVTDVLLGLTVGQLLGQAGMASRVIHLLFEHWGQSPT